MTVIDMPTRPLAHDHPARRDNGAAAPPRPTAAGRSLHWLPSRPDFAASLANIRSKQSEIGADGVFSKLAALASSRLDFIETGRLDRALQTCLADPTLRLASPALRLALLATSTVDQLLPAIRIGALRRGLAVQCHVAPFGQQHQAIRDTGSPLSAFAPDVVLLAMDPTSLVPELPLSIESGAADETIQRQVTELRELWRMARQRFGATIVQQTLLDRSLPLFGSFDSRVAGSPARLVRRLNAALADAAGEDGVLLLDLDWWSGQIGARRLGDRMLWHEAKQEISPAEAPLYGDLLARLLAAIRGLSRKGLVLDLDDTLWGGVIGDDGIDGIVLGPGSAQGEAFAAFQRYLKRLAERGIVLAVSSKNERPIVEAAFERHPEMILRRSDIAVVEASWDDKPSSVRRIADELNLGLDALVFFDDNPAERELMRRTLPAVAVPEVPEAAEAYGECLADAGYFEAVAFTPDDRRRTGQYVANVERKRSLAAATDLETFLRDLAMEIEIAPFDDVNLPRIVQLINKTNQFNLATRRCTEAEIRSLMADPAAATFHIRGRDRFGDNGIVSVVIGRAALSPDGDPALDIETWLMSCRVLGRRIESAALDAVAAQAVRRGATAILGRYVPTARNGLVRDHYRNLGFAPMPESDAAAGETRWILRLGDYRRLDPDVFLRVAVRDG